MIAAANFLRGVWRIFPAVVWAIFGGVVLAILVGWGCYHLGRHDEQEAAAARLAQANAAAARQDAIAREAAANQRVADALQTQARQEELLNAVRDLPDNRPSDRQRAVACARLRQQGTDTANIPACR